MLFCFVFFLILRIVKRISQCSRSGEVKGRILQDVITDYGKLIQVGSVLVLRRPSVLHMTPNCFVTITKKCLIGIFSSQTNEVNWIIYIVLEEKKVCHGHFHFSRLPSYENLPRKISLHGCLNRLFMVIR